MLSLTLFLLPLLALGAPLSTTSGEELHTLDNAVNFGTGGGIIGFIVLVLDILVWSTSQPVPITQKIPVCEWLLTLCANSRTLQVQASTAAQAALGPAGFYLPDCGGDHLLAAERPQEVE